MNVEEQTSAAVAGGEVLDMERDARTIYDIACIRESAKSATREDVEFKAIALRNFNSASAVAELIAADMKYDEARAAVDALRDGVSTLGDVVYAEGALRRARVRRAAALASPTAPAVLAPAGRAPSAGVGVETEVRTISADARKRGYMVDTSIGFDTLERIIAALQHPAAPSAPDLDAAVSRFLCWRLPDDFAPDNGISFTPISNPAWTHDTWPIGTNLLTAVQARAMLEYVLNMPAGAPRVQQPLDETANNAGMATGSRNVSPSESVTPGSPPASLSSAPVVDDELRYVAEQFDRWLRRESEVGNISPNDASLLRKVSAALSGVSVPVGLGVVDELLTNIKRACVRGRNAADPTPENSSFIATFDHIEDLAQQAKRALTPPAAANTVPMLANDQHAPWQQPMAFSCANARVGQPGSRCGQWCGDSTRCISTAAAPRVECNCHLYGKAEHCPLHTQADYDSATTPTEDNATPAAEQPEARGVEGMVLVPRSPTPGMLHFIIGDTHAEGRVYYAAMLAAAPEPVRKSELYAVAKRNLRTMIVSGSADKTLMLKCLEEL